MEDVASKVDFSHVKSCVAVGTHHGEREIDFTRRLLPNLQSFVAVERDPEAVEVLRANLQKQWRRSWGVRGVKGPRTFLSGGSRIRL